MDAKLDLILAKLVRLEQDVGGLKADVGGLKADVGGLKADVGGLSARVDRQDARMDELVAAFRENWADMSSLYRRVREDVKLFEDRLEAKISQVNQSIVALKDSLDRQDFRSDSLGRRIAALEEPQPPTFDR
jgi:chromosome segregation ATPase